MAFRQDDPFINDATNGLTFGNGGALTVVAPFPSTSQLRPYPASSLNGEVNAFLTNNVLYSHLTSELTNTARVRYYDRQDNTPTLTFLNYACRWRFVDSAASHSFADLLYQIEHRGRTEVAAQSHVGIRHRLFLRALHVSER